MRSLCIFKGFYLVKVTKEVAVKFIEMDRLSVDAFDEFFKQVHKTVSESLQENTIKGGEQDLHGGVSDVCQEKALGRGLCSSLASVSGL
jgi:hypothetical protein